MTVPHHPERPLDVSEAPTEENVSDADVADRVDLDPEEQPNRTDPVQGGAVGPEDAS